MIRISPQHSISRKNGYFQYHQHAIKGKDSKHAGDEYISVTKTYLELLSLYSKLKSIGEDGNRIVAACQALLEASTRPIVRTKKALMQGGN